MFTRSRSGGLASRSAIASESAASFGTVTDDLSSRSQQSIDGQPRRLGRVRFSDGEEEAENAYAPRLDPKGPEGVRDSGKSPQLRKQLLKMFHRVSGLGFYPIACSN